MWKICLGKRRTWQGDSRGQIIVTPSPEHTTEQMHKLVTDEHVTYHTIGASLSKPHTSEKASL